MNAATSSESKPSCLLTLPWSPWHAGGVNEIVKRLVGHLSAERNVAPLVMVGAMEERLLEWDAAQPYPILYQKLGIPCYPPSPVRSCLAFLYHLPARLFQLRKLVRRHDVRIVNIHYPNLGDLHFSLLRMLGLYRGGLLVHFHLGDAQGAVLTRGIERWLWQVLLRSADRLITDSDDLQPELLKLDPKCKSKLLTVHNGVDVEFCSSRPTNLDRFPPELNGRPVILSIGNFEERKGHHILMRAFQQVRQRIPQVGLVMVGGPSAYFPELKRLHAELALEGHAFMIESVPHEHVPAYLSRSRLFALPTHAEAFSLAILEAGAAGLPIVSTRARGVIEAIKDGVTGRLIEIDDVNGLARTLIELLENPAEAQRLADNFQTEIRNGLTWKHHYENYRRVYLQYLDL
jgi:glycosyltransferase involved in cell wall biosynthesis